MSYFWNYQNVLKTTGQIIFYSSFIFLIPIILSLFFQEGLIITNTYVMLFLLTLIFGGLFYKYVPRKRIFGVTTAQSIIIVCFVWLLFTFFSSLPFHFLGNLSIIDAYFESMSSITTTGMTMYSSVPSLESLVVWRSLISWIGGLGIVVLAYFGLAKGVIGSSTKLVIAEGHERLRPSIKKTIRDMWIIYSIITIIGVVLLFIFGMSLFDSFNYSMSAISTTGIESNAATLAGIGTPLINIVLIILMLLGATSFILHYSFKRSKNIFVYLKDKQFLFMLLIIFIIFLLVFLKLGTDYDIITLLLNVVGMATGGGFATLNPSQFLAFSPFVFLIFLITMFIGGSTNATAGGIKMDRFILFIKSIFWKIKQNTLPKIAYFSKKYNGEIVEDSTVKAIYFLILVYFLFIILGVLVLTFSGYPIAESSFEVISSQSNVGLTVGITDQAMPFASKIMLIINMWVGRLEIIPVLSVLGIIFSGKHHV